MRITKVRLCATLAVGVAGCSVNGKSLLSFGGGNSSSGSPSPSSPSNSSSAPAPVSAPTRVAEAPPSGPAPSSYAWCAKAEKDHHYTLVSHALGDYLEHALPGMIQTLCFPDSDEVKAKRNEIEAARQAVMKRLQMTEADWATDVVEWANGGLKSQIELTDDAAWSTMGPLQQWEILTKSTGWSSAFSLQTGAKNYIADAVALTETGRAAFVSQCIHTAYPDQIDAVAAAVCQPDIDALDPAKIGAEIRAAKDRPASERMAVRIGYGKLVPELAAHAAKVKKLLAGDPVYKQMFEIASSTRKDWAGNSAARAELLGLVLAMDDARATKSRKAIAGCSDKTWPAFAAAIGKLPAKRFENIQPDWESAVTFADAAMGVVLRDPDAYLAANALVTCEGEGDHLTGKLWAGLRYWPGFRGPRTGTVTAIMLANLQPDKADEKIKVPESRLPLPVGGGGWKNAGKGFAHSVVASVKEEGDLIKITFPKQSAMQDRCLSSRRTNRISRIDSSGNLIYETECTKWTSERVDTTLDAVTVAKRYGAGVKPKMYVSVINGAVEGVWQTAKSKTPVAAFGVAIK